MDVFFERCKAQEEVRVELQRAGHSTVSFAGAMNFSRRAAKRSCISENSIEGRKEVGFICLAHFHFPFPVS